MTLAADFQPGPNDIAVIGLGLHVPGADSSARFWQNLHDGVESVRRFTDAELTAAGVAQELLDDPNYVKAGAVLDGVELFDAEFFGLSAKEAAIMDPQHRHFLECAWEALENGARTPDKFDGRIGVFAGCGMGSYFQQNILTNPELVDSVGMFLLRHTGNDKDFLATRVSYCFDLKGPSVSVQTACSTSLVAIHTACQSLLAGECDMALAGGSTIELPHRQGYLYKKNEILSPDGHCRAFDHRSQGTIFGSGAGVIALRRLEDALRDGDRVLAIVKGSAVNNDGAGKVGYFAPSVEGQSAAMAEAMAVADVPADSIGYVECHGTGTPIGDPIEIAALTHAYRQSTDRKGFCAIGSVKTNIGHLDTAAGVVGVSKVVLSLEHKQLPASLNFEAPNPAIDFESSPFQVNAKLRDWAAGPTPRRAAVNSLGVGGTNAHLILEEAPQRPESSNGEPTQLLTLSARNRAALDDAARRLAEHLRAHPEQKLADVAYTLFQGRKKFDVRRVVAASSHEEAATLLDANPAARVFTHKAADAKPSVVFMFPGGGAQYPRMGCELYDSEPVYRQWIDRGLAWLDGKLDIDLRALWFAQDERDAASKGLWERPSIQLPALYLCEYALAQLWISRGVKPAALLGHSLGENTAGAVAGVFSFEDGLGLVTLRGKLFERVTAGGMLSVPLAAEVLLPMLGDALDLATINGPELCTVSGTNGAIEAFAARLSDDGVEAKRIPIKIAAHSRLLEPILADFAAYLRSIPLRKPTLPIVSNRTGTWLTDAEAIDPLYWVGHLRHTIRFADNISTLLKTPGRVMLEVGPGKTLGSLARQHRELQQSQTIISSLKHAKETVNDAAFFLTALGRLWAVDVAIDEALLWPNQRRHRIELPSYPFQRSRYWIEPGKGSTAEQAGASLPERIADPNKWFYRPTWKQREVEEADETLAPTTWLVFVDEAGLGDRLVARLRSRGHEVVTVRPGDAFARHGADSYVLAPEHGRDGYDALVRALVAGGKVPSRIVHLWLTTKDESFRPGSSFFHRNQEHGFYSLLFLAQAIGAEALPGPLHISVVTSGMQQTRDEALPYPEKGTVLGPVGVIPRELTGTTCDTIDVALPQPRRFGGKRRATEQLETIVAQLFDELAQPPANRRTALRDDRRYELAYVKQSPAGAAPLGEAQAVVDRVRKNGVYLLTGGLGGIGLVVAEHLARTAKAKLVLVGRSTLPPAGEWDTWLRSHADDEAVSRKIQKVRELESLGAEVLLAEADVTDLEAMRGVVATAKKRFGGLHGVVHAAGTIRDDLIPFKTQSDAEEVFAPKVHGTLVLDQLLADERLDFFVLFSSTSTAICPAGQVDYVAANAFLNTYAQSRCRADRFVVALNWGIWNEVGMTAKPVADSTAPASDREEPVVHPLFDYRLGNLHDAEVALIGRHSVAAHWVYDEHRTAGGQAMLPGTGYLELARSALAEVGETGGFTLEDLFFLRPLALEDDGSREVGVVLARSAEGYDFRVQSRLPTVDRTGNWDLHAQGRLILSDAEAPANVDIDIAAIDLRCERLREANNHGELRTKQEDHLRFGPRWRVLQAIAYGDNEALAHLALPRKFLGDLEQYRLHPALLDLATGFAMSLIDGYENSRDLWVPVSYKQLQYFAPLEAEIVSWVRGHGVNKVDAPFATFDITVTDRSGRVLLEVAEFTLKRLASPEIFTADAIPTSAGFVGAALEATGTNDIEREPASRTELAFRRNLRNGIRSEEGAEAFAAVLRRSTSAVSIVSSLDLPALIRQADAIVETAKTDGSAKFARPQIEGELIEPRDDLERTLVGIWSELLGVESIGVRDSFFDLGGHSLIAVRLFAQIKKSFHVEFPISVLFGAPTIEACANLIRAEIGDAAGTNSPAQAKPERQTTRYTHLVAMHEGAGNSKRPLFIVAGMFGNILNLRHLAHLVGNDRPCYGLQARGLYGEHEPHETFEEMAVDYLRELRTVQPQGPYLLAGFSGGGITAYEMARQLKAAGEEVALLCMLDTPLPVSRELWVSEKIQMHLQRIAKEKHRYFWNFISDRCAWEYRKLMNRLFPKSAPTETTQYHSATIQQAFLKACDLYRTPDYHGKMLLLRPRQKPTHVFGPNRMINHDRRFIFPDNGWSQHGVEVELQEVPGDHDSMVLEPHVRTLATKLRKAIDRAEAAYSGRRRPVARPAASSDEAFLNAPRVAEPASSPDTVEVRH
ncbi:MAG: SDR family NAD(P)-dependent oxidoreductase [Planctomycetia bacterium]|nr:SDR family NAD(P)-dependent oxidoreductase [Planctomycetia bacterium]